MIAPPVEVTAPLNVAVPLSIWISFAPTVPPNAEVPAVCLINPVDVTVSNVFVPLFKVIFVAVTSPVNSADVPAKEILSASTPPPNVYVPAV